ncbi:MAG: DUF2169 domain-containing protein, partial [Polyangiaceae bacterium]|nr:DUF2169 domain-containing protein [Polyangiaceae bacterium]
GILTRVFEHGRDPMLVVTVFAAFPFDEPRALFTEQALWRTMGEELGPGGAFDTGLPKPRGEVIVDAIAYAPGGEPQPGVSVELEIASVKKQLWVAGARHWELLGMTMPEPFVEMPVDWAHAFGGEGFAHNPLGRGVAPVVGADGKKHHPLPNVEYPDQRVQSKGDKPKQPASFRAIDYTWPQRMKRLGTYDSKWFSEEFPGFARDIDLEAFNAAPEDQRITGFFEGSEEFSVVNMHPTEPKIASRLPGLVARVFATVVEDGAEELREVAMRADTVQLFPHRKMGVVVFRGILKIKEDDANDVKHLLVAAERIGEPRDADHYRAVLEARLDKQRGGLLALRDSDLLPDVARYEGDDPFVDEMMKKLGRDNLIEENLHRRAVKNYADRVAKARALGFDPAEVVGPPPEPIQKTKVDPENVAEVVAASQKKSEEEEIQLEEARKNAEEKARELCQKNGIDYDEMMKKAGDEGGGPPQISADRELAKLRAAVADARANGVPMPQLEAMAADPRFESRLRENERSLIELYRRFAHHMPPVTDADASLAEARGEMFKRTLEESAVAERDFSGADLRGVDFRGKDLRRAFLEKANLEGANLEGADLEGAVLARANLKGANLSKAKLKDANLGHADLTNARFEGADLAHATFDKATLKDTVLAGATLTGTTIDEAVLDGVDLSGAKLDNCIFRKAKMPGTKLDRATLESVLFVECELEKARFGGATLTKSAFFMTRADGIDFCDAMADNVRFVHECTIKDAVFTRASLKGANFRDSDLSHATFEGADMEGAELSNANLEGAKIERANLREARLVRANLAGASLASTNLIGSIMQKARVGGASFQDANLFRADLAYVTGDDATTFSGAYIDQVRTIRRNA